MAATAGQAHALVVNYETELVASFGVADSLGEYLRFPVFVQSLSPAGAKEQLALRRKLPADVKTYITEFESSLDERVTESERYDYRVLLVQVKGSKTEADAAVTFVRAEDLTEERLKQMEAEGKVGAGVIVEKQRDAGHQHKGDHDASPTRARGSKATRMRPSCTWLQLSPSSSSSTAVRVIPRTIAPYQAQTCKAGPS